MNIASRTPEGDPNRCPVCGKRLRLEPSRPPGDAPCPSCGSLVWFPTLEPATSSTDTSVRVNGELKPAGCGDSIPLLRPVITIGRRESCDICVRMAHVSGLHCQLAFRTGHWVIKDLDSTNGIKVNGVSVPEKILCSGDVITIGKRNYTIEYASDADSDTLGATV